jgi:hypothetical protein
MGCSRSLSPFSRSQIVERSPSRSRRRRLRAPSQRAPRFEVEPDEEEVEVWFVAVMRTASMSFL